MATIGGNGNGNGKKKRNVTRPLGRATKCTKERTEKIAALVAAGVTQKAAAECCDTNEFLFCEWMQRGRERKAPCYVAFFQAIEHARNVWIARAERAIDEAGQGPKGDWRALAWKLERRLPGIYGPPEQRLKHAGDADNPVEVKHSGGVTLAVSAEQLAEVARILAEADPEGE